MVNFSALGMCFKLAVDRASPSNAENIKLKTIELYKIYHGIMKAVASMENERMGD